MEAWLCAGTLLSADGVAYRDRFWGQVAWDRQAGPDSVEKKGDRLLHALGGNLCTLGPGQLKQMALS